MILWQYWKVNMAERKIDFGSGEYFKRLGNNLDGFLKGKPLAVHLPASNDLQSEPVVENTDFTDAKDGDRNNPIRGAHMHVSITAEDKPLDPLER